MFYVGFAYDLVRSDTSKLILLYVTLFAFTFQIIKSAKFKFKTLVLFSVIFRLLFLFAIPNLSQDFYRFIWDGRIILNGLNPYLYKPNSFIENGVFPIADTQELFNGMGSLSASHFTNYPPINQLCFVVANLFPGQSILSSVIGLRLIIIAADIGTLYFGKKLLERLKLPSNNIFWYILNPFIIIELTGNLHFEGVMIFFLVWSLYLLHSGKWKWAAVVLACSISVKLIPLMLLPLFFNHFKTPQEDSKTTRFLDTIKNLNLPRLIGFYSIVIGTIILLFIPFFSMEFVNNYSKTVGLWFGNFEFNASIYYLARAIGYAITGYNEIAIIGKILPVISVLFILGFSFFKDNSYFPKLITSMLLALTLYLFLSTTVHPWYIATVLLLSVFTKYKFPIVWSIIIILSYAAYANDTFSENLWIIGLEYCIVFSVFIWEVVLKKRLLVA
nr:mannosyltransferase [Winogradskyella eckloniae]